MRTILSSLCAVIVATVLLTDVAIAQGKKTPEQQYDALTKKFDEKVEELRKARDRIFQRMKKAKTIAERTKINREFSNLIRNSPVAQLTPKFVKFAKANPKSELGMNAMAWVMRNNPREPSIPGFRKSILKHHATSLAVYEVLPAMQRAMKTIPVDYLRKIIDDNRSQLAKATASVLLAGQLKSGAETEGDMKQYEESIAFFENTSKNYGSFPLPRGGTISELCRNELKGMRGPRALGKVTPDIVAEDIEGKEFKLSESRGKVVVLDFWGDWQPRCRKMYAHKQKLVKRLANKPFALIGVNSDRKRNKIKQVIKQKNITWRSFWNGGTRGPISTEWKVSIWPTIYVIDAKGVIRYKNIHGATMDKAIDKLLAELAKADTKE